MFVLRVGLPTRTALTAEGGAQRAGTIGVRRWSRYEYNVAMTAVRAGGRNHGEVRVLREREVGQIELRTPSLHGSVVPNAYTHMRYQAYQ